MKRLLILFALILLPTAASAQVSSQTARRFTPTTFAGLGTPTDNSVRWCTNCQATSPCTGGGTGAYAYGETGGAWSCNVGAGGGGVTNSAGANVITKSDGTNLVASSITDNGTTVAISEPITQTSNSATAFQSGPNGGTNPTFRLVNNTASAVNGLSVTGGASGSPGRVTLTAIGSDSNVDIFMAAKGTGGVFFNDGAASRPGIGFASSGSGFYVPAGDQIAIEQGFTRTHVFSGNNILFGSAGDTVLGRESAGVFQIGNNAADASGSLKLTNLTTTATASTGTAAIIDASNVLRPQTSSLRFKENVREWHPNAQAMNAFLSLKPIRWDYKNGGAPNVVGFSAESLAAVDPKLVNYDDEGKPYSNRDAAMVSYLFEIVKKQQAQINSLEAMVRGKRKARQRRSH